MAKATLIEGQTATNPSTGERIIYRGGKWLPYSGDAVSDPPPALTQDQGHAQTYARLMQNAEGSYNKAVQDGYNPSDLRNGAASVFEGLPLGGLDGVGALIRNDVGDRGRQAELQWSDAQLKAVSGAAAPESEVKRNVKTFFARPGETFDTIAPQKAAARTSAYEGAVMRSGPAAAAIAPKKTGGSIEYTAAANKAYAARQKAGKIDRTQLLGSAKRPYIARTQADADALPPGSHVILPDGSFGVVE